MSLAVSDCFWRMVRDSIEAQTDAFRAARFNLETEWRNTFPRVRELDRDELFDKARGEILDEVVNLSQVNADEWEHLLKEKLLGAISEHVFNQILLPTSTLTNPGAFKTAVDIRLKHWAEKELANVAVNVGWDSLKEVFCQQVEGGVVVNKSTDTESGLFEQLKKAVVESVLNEHEWDMKATDYLVIILNTIFILFVFGMF
jgi:optic atrophy protein 1